MNQEKHWNNIADTYDDEVFDVFESDRNKTLQKYFKKHANKTHNAIDFGCGIGKAFKYMAPTFRRLIATDISEDCISIARVNHYSNIEYKKADLTSASLRFPKADFGLCCNVAILPEPRDNIKIIRTVNRNLNEGGHALFVIPSLDSILHYAWRLIDWYDREGVSPDRIAASEFNYFKGPKHNIFRGIIDIRGVRTKHYAQPEIEVTFPRAGFKVLNIERLEYDWETEFMKPPSWMKAPYPWDWMVEVRK